MRRRERRGMVGDLRDHGLEQSAVDAHAAMAFRQA